MHLGKILNSFIIVDLMPHFSKKKVWTPVCTVGFCAEGLYLKEEV